MNNARSRSQARASTGRCAALVAIRLLPQARHMLAQKAQLRGVSLSEFIRSSAMLTASATNVGSLSR